jgi:hypothetical protein
MTIDNITHEDLVSDVVAWLLDNFSEESTAFTIVSEVLSGKNIPLIEWETCALLDFMEENDIEQGYASKSFDDDDDGDDEFELF